MSAREHAQVHCESVLPFDWLSRFRFRHSSSPTAKRGAGPGHCRPVRSNFLHVEVAPTTNLRSQNAAVSHIIPPEELMIKLAI
ncbi:hypothetical protein Pyn_13255 [Prunus yedoensis var. nudiflora]|uniref:Uncharacterized protein n=1 Tax=Prunus yedoensis var. nudiflora TaxID=2094558 RepID=A0A314UKT2_PRUYE|nr:hypothetical protein Pyn_13255 [Prunus yedoensis var. nudiflora]